MRNVIREEDQTGVHNFSSKWLNAMTSVNFHLVAVHNPVSYS